MVRLNKQTDFQFPFIVPDSSTSIQLLKPNHLDLADRILSIFAGTFFFVILLAITLDNSNSSKLISTNSIAQLKPQVKAIIPLANLEQKEIQINKNEKPQVLENKKLVLAPTEIETKSKTNITQQVIIPSSNPIQPQPSPISINEIKENLKPLGIPNKEEVHINQPKNPEVAQIAIEERSAKTKTVSPKPVFVDHKMEAKNLALNEKITQDLLPLSYFHAKEKAAHEGKLLYIKLGAKWCLPCRQMEKTTFKDEKVKDFSEKNYVSLSVDVDDFDGVNMKAYFNVKFLPTLLIFNSQGNFIAKYVNYQSATSMFKILEKHKSENKTTSVIASNEVTSTTKIKTEKIASVDFNNIILSKKRNGDAINSLKSKAKNWRFTTLNFSAKNITQGELLLKVKETTTRVNLTELNIPIIKNQGIADTTTNFQLVLEHEKRKKKNGEYVVEIYHLTQNDSMLVGKTTLLKDGEIHF